MSWLLGHRGSRATTSIPENTLASFDLALDHGCDGFEFDVRLTADGRAVVCHDPKVGGITVAKATSKQLLHLPLLEDVVQRYAGRAFLNIELKVPGLESKVVSELNVHTPARGCVVSSFEPEVVIELKRCNASIQVGIILDQHAQLEQCRELTVDYVIPHFSLVTQELVGQLHHAGKRLITWTVNDRASMLRLADWGVDGIISDDTELLTQTLRKKL
jgi:glycerophosphoryl diester phosphodiesterase